MLGRQNPTLPHYPAVDPVDRTASERAMLSSFAKLALITGSSALLVLCAAAAFAGPCSRVIEEDLTYTVEPGDYLLRVAGMHGVELDYLLAQNPQTRKYLRPGDRFRITRRTIVPTFAGDGVVVNIPDRTLYIFRGGELAAHFPVGLGKPNDWETPSGGYKVVDKQKDPAWRVPKSIQREMEELGEEVRTLVPPGEDNPLGRHAIRLSEQDILIHATIWPESVYRFRSHGCIRMRDKDAESVFGLVEVGDDVNIIYQPVKLALTDDGAVYLEVHNDVYGHAGDLGELAASEIKSAALEHWVDWKKVREVVRVRDGMATEVTVKESDAANGKTDILKRGADDRAFPWSF